MNMPVNNISYELMSTKIGSNVSSIRNERTAKRKEL